MLLLRLKSNPVSLLAGFFLLVGLSACNSAPVPRGELLAGPWFVEKTSYANPAAGPDSVSRARAHRALAVAAAGPLLRLEAPDSAPQASFRFSANGRYLYYQSPAGQDTFQVSPAYDNRLRLHNEYLTLILHRP